MYAKIVNEQIQTIASLKAEYPNTSFPSPLPNEHDGWQKVQQPTLAEGELVTKDVEFIDGTPFFTKRGLTREEKLSYLNEEYEAILDGGITVNNIFIATRERDRGLINGAVTRALLDNDDTKTYPYFPTGADAITLTNAQYKAIGSAVALHTQNCLQASDTIRLNIDDYTTYPAIKTALKDAYNAL